MRINRYSFLLLPVFATCLILLWSETANSTGSGPTASPSPKPTATPTPTPKPTPTPLARCDWGSSTTVTNQDGTLTITQKDNSPTWSPTQCDPSPLPTGCGWWHSFLSNFSCTSAELEELSDALCDLYRSGTQFPNPMGPGTFVINPLSDGSPPHESCKSMGGACGIGWQCPWPPTN